MGSNSESRKRHEALFSDPRWRTDAPEVSERQTRVLTALRKVYGTADLTDASALADALEDEGLLK